MKKQYNIIDLFCGCGGLSKGFEEAGYKTLLGVDIEQAALKKKKKKAVELFLQGKISFLQIGEIAQRTVQHFSSAVGSYTLQDVFDCDAEARRFAQQNTSGR